jgi:hypothetical protein
MGFFPSKFIFVDFFFNIKLVENLALFFFFFLLTEKLNHVTKALYLSSQNTVDCYKSFCSVSKFLITNIIPLISITYLVLVHNYNIINYICFISSRQRAGKLSRIYYLLFLKSLFGTIKGQDKKSYDLFLNYFFAPFPRSYHIHTNTRTAPVSFIYKSLDGKLVQKLMSSRPYKFQPNPT